ncbi:MAG: hypothetical protein GY895_18345 [Phycisphaera sp.]|nr:hypothetical protein [Phycisphaera sp.]
MMRRSTVGRWMACGLAFSVLGWNAGCDTPKDKSGDWFEGGAEMPPNEETLRMTARILASKGEFAKAGYTVDRMIVEHPLREASYTEGAEILLQQGRVVDAILLLDLGLDRLPGNPILLNDRGLCRLLEADLSGATLDFAAALEADPRDADYVANMALVLALSGDEKASRKLWSRVLPADEVESNLELARAARGRFVRAAEEPLNDVELDG